MSTNVKLITQVLISNQTQNNGILLVASVGVKILLIFTQLLLNVERPLMLDISNYFLAISKY